MALQGTLDDFSIVELLQFPYAGRKTGRLAITSQGGSGPEATATLFYRQGKLIHATLGSVEGNEVLVQIVDWEKGEFRFHPDEESPAASIELDLHRLLMMALKTRDERRWMEQQQREAGRALSAPAAEGGALLKGLKSLAGRVKSLVYLCVLTSDGQLAAEWEPRGTFGGRERMRAILTETMKSYAGASLHLQRVMLEDEREVIVLASIDTGRALAVAAGKGTSLGAVAVSVSRAAADMVNRT
jgi:predicted regulator of Ras-like GTPase activity (Roadblock/LC7/MglB family)